MPLGLGRLGKQCRAPTSCCLMRSSSGSASNSSEGDRISSRGMQNIDFLYLSDMLNVHIGYQDGWGH